MKKIFASIAFMLMAVTSWAHDVEINGIYYNIIEKTKEAHVTYKGSSYKEYDGEYSGSVTIPASFEYNGATYAVTSIGECTFYNCYSLTSVTFPNSITNVGGAAFSRCSGLTSVYISSLESWCNIKFENSFSNPLTYAHHLYINDTEIKDLVVPNSVTSIGSHAFAGCSGLTSVTIPNSVTSIGWNAFEGCSALTSVTIPKSVTSIESSAFSGCSALTSVTIPNSVTSIGWGTFYGCM